MSLAVSCNARKKDADLAEGIESHLAHEQMPTSRAACLWKKLAVRPA